MRKSGYTAGGLIPRFLVRQEAMESLFERLRESVVFVGGRDPSTGQFVPCGTGFFVVKEAEDFGFQYIVTARHIIEEIYPESDPSSVIISIRINKIGGGSEIRDTRKSDWVRNLEQKPFNDIAVCWVNIRQDTYAIRHVMLDQDLAVGFAPYRSELGQEVFTVGLFTSHYGEAHNIPIIRQGTIAATVDEPIFTEYGYMHGYLVDLKSIGGLSGSPVFWRQVKTESSPIKLVGVMHGHFLIENPEDAISPSGKERSTGQINTGIGVIIPVQRVIDVINLPDLEADRMKKEKLARSKSAVKADSAAGLLPRQSPATDENPNAREDFIRLVGAAAQKQKQDD